MITVSGSIGFSIIRRNDKKDNKIIQILEQLLMKINTSTGFWKGQAIINEIMIEYSLIAFCMILRISSIINEGYGYVKLDCNPLGVPSLVIWSIWRVFYFPYRPCNNCNGMPWQNKGRALIPYSRGYGDLTAPLVRPRESGHFIHIACSFH